MATQLFLNTGAVTTHLGTNSPTLVGGTPGWFSSALALTRGAGSTSAAGNTVTGPTVGIELSSAGLPNQWISDPVSADVTISGAITGNIWASESDMSANVAINFVVDVIRAAALTAGANNIVQIVKSARVTECAVTTPAVNNFTATPGAGVLVNRGDRIRVRIFGDDAGTMATGFTFTVKFSGSTGGADGDTFITFTENFGFESAPAGTTIYFTDTVSDVSTAAVDLVAWTDRGAGVTSDVTNTAAGWTAPIQITDTAGGTVVEWYTKQLQAFTLTGMARANLRFLESNALANASAKCEIARVDSDGSNPTVWASWCISHAAGSELGTTERAETAWLSGDDLVFTNGQRIRIRVYVDDMSSFVLVTGHTVTFFYNGTSGGASGDSYVILPQTVTEFVAAAPGLARPNLSRRYQHLLVR